MSIPVDDVPPIAATTAVTTVQPVGAVARFAWSSIFAGAMLVLAIEVLLDILGAGVGLGIVHPGSSNTPTVSGLGIGAGVWWFVASIIAFIFSCYVAARMAGVPTRFDGVLHGLVIWALAMLVTIYLITSVIGGVIGGAFSVVGSTISAAGQGLKTAVPEITAAAGVTPAVLQQQARSLLQQSNQNPATMSPEDAEKEVVRLLPGVIAGGNQAKQDKSQIIAIMAAQLKISPADAEKKFNAAETHFTEAKQHVVQGAEKAAQQTTNVTSHAALIAFFWLLVSAIAAAIGGALASPRPPFITRWVKT